MLNLPSIDVCTNFRRTPVEVCCVHDCVRLSAESRQSKPIPHRYPRSRSSHSGRYARLYVGQGDWMFASRDTHGRIAFTDIVAPQFDAKAPGYSQEKLMDEIRAVLPDGTRLSGVEVFAECIRSSGSSAPFRSLASGASFTAWTVHTSSGQKTDSDSQVAVRVTCARSSRGVGAVTRTRVPRVELTDQ